VFCFAMKRNPNVVKNILSTPYDDIYVSAIAVEETLGGFFIELERCRTSKKDVDLKACFESVFKSMAEFQKYKLLPFTNEQETLYKSIYRKSANVHGKGDWRIAAQAIETKKIVVTNNTEDFRRIQEYVPELRFVDWTKADS
jgi:predicted nucleic acid-binding protein